ncbi:MAG: endonuclease, partial [bacterium]
KMRTGIDQASIYQNEFLLEKDQKYMGEKPFRTYHGPAYHGGYSDHLPVYTDLFLY